LKERDQGSFQEKGKRLHWRGVLRSVVLPVGVLALILGGLWYWQERGSGEITDDPRFGVVELPEDRNATGRPPAAEEGRAAVDFVLENVHGGTLRLSSYQGGPVLLNFWATWCGPCRQEMPEFVDAFRDLEDEGLTIIAVNLQESNARVLEFADEFGLEFPVVIDRDGEVAKAWRIGGPFEGLPSSYFIDERGIVTDVHLGQLTEAQLRERLSELLPGAVS
jgi:peroxiredoxin